MKTTKLVAYLREEAQKFPRPVRVVRVWWRGVGDTLQGHDIRLDDRVVLPLGAIPSERIDWSVNLTDNHDFDGEDELCVLSTSVGPIITP